MSSGHLLNHQTSISSFYGCSNKGKSTFISQPCRHIPLQVHFLSHHVSDCSPRNGRRSTRCLLLILHPHGLWSLEPATTTALRSLWQLGSCTGPCSGCTDKTLLASRSQLCCCCCSWTTDTHGLHCTRNRSHPVHCKCPRISPARINASPLAMQCNAGCGGGGWCIAGGAAHPAPGWPCLLCHCRPRAAPTHLRAAAIRLNVAIWTNMDPSEGGRKCSHECSQDTCFRLILKVDNISSFH